MSQNNVNTDYLFNDERRNYTGGMKWGPRVCECTLEEGGKNQPTISHLKFQIPSKALKNKSFLLAPNVFFNSKT